MGELLMDENEIPILDEHPVIGWLIVGIGLIAMGIAIYLMSQIGAQCWCC
jgi:hypothetical protein